MINKKNVVKILQDLIRIDSQNPPGDESRIGVFVKNYLAKLGLEVKIYEFKPNRSNVLAYCGDPKAKSSLLITPHLDTVPKGISWKCDPFGAGIRNGRIYGLGATDCKANIAVSLEAIRSLVEDKVKLDYRLVFAATADEETGSDLGLIPLLDKGILKPDAALVLDADDFGVVVTQKGLIHLKVKIKGKRAHGAYPWLGINAIDVAVKILAGLKKPGFFPPAARARYLREPTVNIGTIRGGDKVNIVADSCEFELDFRFLPGMSEQRILEKLKGLIRKYSARYKIEIEGIQKPYSIAQGHPLVSSLKAAMKKFKIKPRVTGSEGATTITFFQDKHIPAIASGFGTERCAHTPDEYAKIENLYKGAQVLEEFLRRYK